MMLLSKGNRITSSEIPAEFKDAVDKVCKISPMAIKSRLKNICAGKWRMLNGK